MALCKTTDNPTDPPKSISTFLDKNHYFLNPQSSKMTPFTRIIMDIIYKIIIYLFLKINLKKIGEMIILKNINRFIWGL